MHNYIFAYYGGKKPESPEAGAREMERWKAWLAGLGNAVINPGTPLGKSRTVSANGVTDGGRANPMIGFSIIKADSMEAALKMAQACPFLEQGTIVVSQAMEM